MKDTQILFVKAKLQRDGFITRNECLNNYISRLGAIIAKLKALGWEFEAEYKPNPTKGKDYVYTLIKEGA